MYVITKLGLLFVYDLETATAVYRTRISADSIFLAAPAPTSGGFTAINRSACCLLLCLSAPVWAFSGRLAGWRSVVLCCGSDENAVGRQAC